MEIFKRAQENPILKPNPANSWESLKLYNPGAIFDGKKYHLFYRAIGGGSDWHSCIGHALSLDGINFERLPEPALVPTLDHEVRGLEDPRLTKIGDTYYMAHATFDGEDVRLQVATSSDLYTWQKHTPALTGWCFSSAGGVYRKFTEDGIIIKEKKGEWSKSGAIFPEKFDGKFRMLFGEYNIWSASSDDGISWTASRSPFLAARSGDFFDNTFVEMGPPPILTKRGWLILYHGIDQKHCYRLGFLLLDKSDPSQVLYRHPEPIFWPEAHYELSGLIDVIPGGLDKLLKMDKQEQKTYIEELRTKHQLPQVIFCCGSVLRENELRIYYGAGDSVICTATADIGEILKLINE